MYTANFNKYYSKNDILIRINQLEVWQWILDLKINEGETFCNPFRKDTKPGCWLSYGKFKVGLLVMNDFADVTYHGIDIFQAIKLKFKITLQEVLEMINDVFNLRLNTSSPSKILNNDHTTKRVTQHKNIVLNNRLWSKQDAIYWKEYDISRTQLDSDSVVPIQSWTIYTQDNSHSFFIRKVTYALYINNNVKLYSPYSKNNKSKWPYSNVNKDDIWGFNDFPIYNKCIITKSYKDYRVLKNLCIKYNLKYDIYGVQNESLCISFNAKQYFLSNYNEIILFYDNDKAGIKGANKNKLLFNSDKVRCVNTKSKYKDIAEYYKYNKNNKEFKRKLLTMINTIV